MLRYVTQFAYIVNNGSSVLQPILNIITMQTKLRVQNVKKLLYRQKRNFGSA